MSHLPNYQCVCGDKSWIYMFAHDNHGTFMFPYGHTYMNGDGLPLIDGLCITDDININVCTNCARLDVKPKHLRQAIEKARRCDEQRNSQSIDESWNSWSERNRIQN